MHLERLLGSLKQAARVGKAVAEAERAVYSGETTCILQRHLQQGRRDPRQVVETRSDLKKAGLHVMQVGRQSAGDDDGMGSSSEPDRPIQSGMTSQQLSIFDCGDDEWPVRQDILDYFLAVHPRISDHARGTHGYRNKSALVRDHAKSELIVEDCGHVPDDKVYSHRFSCSELHYGLCCTHHAHVYRAARKLQQSLERCLSSDLVHHFFSIVSSRSHPPMIDQACSRTYFCLARVKSRRYHCQITHVIVNCVVLDEYQDGRTELSLGQRAYQNFDFVSLSMIARDLLAQNCLGIYVQQLEHFSGPLLESASVTVLVRDDDVLGSWQVWPNVFRPRPRLQRASSDIPDEPGVERRPARNRRPGIKVLPFFLAPLYLWVFAYHPKGDRANDVDRNCYQY